MPRRDFADFACSLARTLDAIGDAWTPLILRDVFLGVNTFTDIARDLGISRALLTTRLDGLVRDGVLHEVEYCARPRRVRYELTGSGLELVPVLIALTQWGDRWRSGGVPPMLFTHDCGSPFAAVVACDACGSAIEASAVSSQAGPGGQQKPGTLVVAERLLAAAR